MEEFMAFEESSVTVYTSKDDTVNCVFCGQRTSGCRDEHCLKCSGCEACVHFLCLAGNVRISECSLLGDVFYKYTCKLCSPAGVEIVAKEKVSWLTVLVLALYNLQEMQHLSRHGFFHWKLHITDFIDRKWNYIFGGNVRRKRAWHGTVSGTLSHYSPSFFQTGTHVLRESGWWKLTNDNMSPFNIVRLKDMKRSAARSIHEEETLDEDLQPQNSCSSIDMFSANASDRISPDLDADLLSYSDSESLDVDIDMPTDIDKEGFPRMDSALSDLVDQYVMAEDAYSDSLSSVHALVKPGQMSTSGSYLSEKESDGSSDSDEGDAPAPPPKSLFKCRQDRKLPWLTDCVSQVNKTQGCVPMSEYEELHLLNLLLKYTGKDSPPVPSQIIRLQRKLLVRREQRHRRLETFADVSSSVYNVNSSCNSSLEKSSSRTLDRYQVFAFSEESQPPQNCQSSFMLRLLGRVEPTCFVSPYTERLLKPFIRRDYQSEPLRLLLMADLRRRANRTESKRYPIDYTYVQPHHIPAINSLCELFFWPGIDLSESLLYPDFSCVALYRKLVIGFAFMVPDVNYNESYISFLFTRPEWRRAGIATFMLYHLIQTCMGKDITLHVSVTNPAVMLYQKFGFKVEELVQDFYDKYLPAGSKECKHALYLRLNR
ncbi:cysteine-rich protein 2-binding protein [Thrips palmi]|uniref:Cysteine-rich protein 2-binding protein n=1 Tax=Thrips palmi TaxID=161013 RepID=A0A6P8YI35_THRPL|nr:cysteine-rich protein 2-binding protein [Thrips palmi]